MAGAGNSLARSTGLDKSMHPQVAARLWLALAGLSSGKRMHDCAQRAFALSQSVGDERGQTWALHYLAFSIILMGRLEEASDANARALAAMRTLGNKLGVAECLNVRAAIQPRCGNVVASRHLFAQALAAYKALGNESGIATVLGSLAELEFGDGQVDQAVSGEANDAARLIGYVNVQYKELGNEREPTEKWGYEKLMAALHEQLTETEIEKLAPTVQRGRKIWRPKQRSRSDHKHSNPRSAGCIGARVLGLRHASWGDSVNGVKLRVGDELGEG